MPKSLSLLVALLLFGAQPHVSWAADSEEVSADIGVIFAPPTPDELRRISMLVDAGRYEDARKSLLLFRMQPAPHMEVVFLSGMVYAGIGEYQNAAAEFRLMLSHDPTLIRPRLELARVLFLDKDFEGASYHFQLALTGNLPDEVRKKIQGFLTAIREQEPSFGMSLDVVSDSNPKQSTSAKTVTIGGRSYRLSVTAPDRSIWGYELNGNARIPLPSDPSWFASTNFNVVDFANNDSDQSYLRVMFGKRIHVNGAALSLEVGQHVFEYRWLKLYDGKTWRLGNFWQQSDQSSWQATMEGLELIYPDYSYMNGWQRNFSLDNRYSVSAQSQLQSGVRYGRNQTREQPYAFSNRAVYLRYVHEWSGGLITGMRCQQSGSYYQGMDPFFGIVRRDRERQLELDVVNRNWQVFGLSPRLLIGNIEHVSVIDMYSFHRSYIKVGVSREF